MFTFVLSFSGRGELKFKPALTSKHCWDKHCVINYLIGSFGSSEKLLTFADFLLIKLYQLVINRVKESDCLYNLLMKADKTERVLERT